mgnify:CR=1 FL=1
MSVFKDETIWRMLTNFWTAFFMIFLVSNFFSLDQYGFLIAPFSIIYIGVLGLYVGTKEFDRWYDLHAERHPGEWFVIIWTIVIFGLIIVSIFLGKEYKVSSEAVAVYIMVLSVFALTQKSKRLYEEKSTAPR